MAGCFTEVQEFLLPFLSHLFSAQANFLINRNAQIKFDK